jgi:hypothetical protein
LTFVDLDTDVVAKELANAGAVRHSGATAENVLRHVRDRENVLSLR